MRTEIIAELAQGFEGDPKQARLLVKAAAAAGADAAKFQLIYADELATADYKHYELFRSLEMAETDWANLAAYAEELGIRLYLDIFGPRSLDVADRIGVTAVKLHGTDIANLGLLNQVANSRIKKVLLGAGGAYSAELRQAIGILADKDVVVLLGFQGYPTPNDANQIARVRLLTAKFSESHSNVAVGFADHALPESPLRLALAAMAIGAGASVVEKHLTLGKVMKLEDHEAALNPDEFLEFSNTIRDCSEALGVADGCRDDFAMSEPEQGYRKMIRRHVVSSRDLDAGHIVTPSDLTLKRTSATQAITELPSVYQRKLKRSIRKDTALSATDLEWEG